MNKHISALALGAALATAAPLAQATVLTFDDIAPGFDAVPANYGGLDWSAGGWYYFDGEQDPYTPHSGESRATIGWYDDVGAGEASSSIRFAGASVFDGAWFSGLQGATVSFDLYLEGTRVWSSAVLDPNATPAFLASGYAGLVDEVMLRGPALYGLAMDDFRFTAAVPEPTGFWLLAAGLAVVGLVAHRRSLN